jgi:hypothetical protein
MRWQGRRKSTNVRDAGSAGGRSALGSGGAAGLVFMLVRMLFNRFGIGGIVILVIGFFALQALGLNPLQLLGGQQASVQQSGQQAAGQADPCNSGDETREFLCVVLASTEDVWNAEFQKRGQSYEEPGLVFFSGGVQAGACGFASSAVGPFYCPATKDAYLDTAFFKELAGRFGAGGDFAQAYVIAHEVGHHIQTITGTSAQVQRAKQGRSKAEQNNLQVRMELQADCLAGVWAYNENQMGYLEDGDIEEALRAANAIGDDTLQRQAGRTPMPDSFTHGTSEQRMRWFKTGYASGRMEDCDTFGAARL